MNHPKYTSFKNAILSFNFLWSSCLVPGSHDSGERDFAGFLLSCWGKLEVLIFGWTRCILKVDQGTSQWIKRNYIVWTRQPFLAECRNLTWVMLLLNILRAWWLQLFKASVGQRCDKWELHLAKKLCEQMEFLVRSVPFHHPSSNLVWITWPLAQDFKPLFTLPGFFLSGICGTSSHSHSFIHLILRKRGDCR